MIKQYIDRIVENGNPKDMDCLSEMLVDLLYGLKETDYKLFKMYKTKLKGMAYEYQIDEELAKEIVSDMKPLGEYWNIETVSSVVNKEGYDLLAMYVVMNSLANDYQSAIPLDNVETYVKLASAWLVDVDGHDHKLWWYFIG